tara:strand:- start:147 stop:488 length:342 start_codon:yes stop_codon:yes gene_type:complete
VTIHWRSHALGLPEIYKDIAEKSILIEVDVKGNGKEEYLSVGKTTDDLVAAYRYASDYFRNLCDFSGHPIEEVEEEFKYIETGGKFRTINVPGVVEELHRYEISKFIKKKEHD